MDTSKLTFSNKVTPIVFIVFVFFILGVFFENILFFKVTLAKAFVEPPVQRVTEIDLDTLSRIVEGINIDKNSVPILTN